MYLSSGFNETGPTIKEYIPGGGGGYISSGYSEATRKYSVPQDDNEPLSV